MHARPPTPDAGQDSGEQVLRWLGHVVGRLDHGASFKFAACTAGTSGVCTGLKYNNNNNASIPLQNIIKFPYVWFGRRRLLVA